MMTYIPDVVAYKMLHGRMPPKQRAKSGPKPKPKQEKPAMPDVKDIATINCPSLQSIEIIKMVALKFHMSAAELTGKNYCRTVSLARHVAMYVIHKNRNLSLPKIGRMLGGRDHTTVLYAVRKIEKIVGDANA